MLDMPLSLSYAKYSSSYTGLFTQCLKFHVKSIHLLASFTSFTHEKGSGSGHSGNNENTLSSMDLRLVYSPNTSGAVGYTELRAQGPQSCPQPLMAARRARQSDRCQVGEVGADLIQSSLQEETVPVATVYGGGGVSRKIFHSGDSKVYLEISYHQ